MRVPLIPVIIFLAIGLLVDWYIYRRIRSARAPRGLCIAYIAVSAIATAALLTVAAAPKKGADDAGLHCLMWALFAYMSIYLPKYLFTLFSLVRQALALIFRRPLKGIAIAGAVAGGLLFILMWWGALFSRFNIDVKEVEVDIPNLPASFQGYRIAQISDIHTGTFGTDTTFLDRVVDKINSLHPDIVLFTGDIVNRHASELKPFTATLSKLSAPDGVWSVMGNHDYGDYFAWPSPEAKAADIALLRRLQTGMGWNMLDNTHHTLRRADSDSLIIIGVENIGEPPFTVYGNLHKAYPDLSDKAVKVLMSHNPHHWTDSIANHADVNIALTLSGHTHAMQAELFGVSPAALRYDTWAGMYTDSLARSLYVNIGLGEVGFPARIGATPEITIFTLK